MKRWRLTCLAGSLAALTAACQNVSQTPKKMQEKAHPTLEVATIHRSDPELRRQRLGMEGSRVLVRGHTVTSLMIFAYGVHKDQIVDGPAWRSEDRYDVDGVPDVAGEPGREQMQEMIRKLLEERFGLKIHAEKRGMTYYAITVAKGGARIKESAPQTSEDQTSDGNGGVQSMRFTGNSMGDFALGMQYLVDRPLVDETGLTGRYDFALRWSAGDAPQGDDAPPGMFTAIQEQLGLKLEPKKGPVNVVVVDKLERPSAN